MELHPYLAVWSGKECGTVAYAQRAPSMHKELILACEWKAQNVEARAPSYCLHFMPYTLCDRISASVLYCAVQHLHHHKAHGLLFRLLRVRRVSALPHSLTRTSRLVGSSFAAASRSLLASPKLIQLHASKRTPKKSLQHARPTFCRHVLTDGRVRHRIHRRWGMHRTTNSGLERTRLHVIRLPLQSI